MEAYSTLQGTLERFTFVNEDTNYTVARFKIEGKRDLTTIVGNMVSVNPGETLKLEGYWVNDRKYGEQFRVERYETVTPSTIVGIERYLGSGMIKGIGPVFAKRVVRTFGLDTLRIIEEESEKLTEIEGIGPVRVEMIRKAWDEQKEIRNVMLFLQGQGISSTYAVKIFKAYGNDAIAKLQENPYCLAMDVYGIGFKTADKIAENLGVAKNSPLRAEAGIIYALQEMSDGGHTFYPQQELIKKASELLGIDVPVIENAIETLKARNQIAVETSGFKVAGQRVQAKEEEFPSIYLNILHAAETGVARRLRTLLSPTLLPMSLDWEKAIPWLEHRMGVTLAAKQIEALKKVLQSRITVITGGPGTGKTTLVKCIVMILNQKGSRFLLAAPTGRAAKRLSEATNNEAKTIHRLLEYSPKDGAFKRNEKNPLPVEFLVLDEVSMVDIVLMNSLLKALPPGTSLILVGDADQLPSVGPGNVLREIIESDRAEVVRLTEIFRQARESLIITNAHRINQGVFPDLKNLPREGDFFFVEKEEPEGVLELIRRMCSERIPRGFGFNPLEDIQVLCPMNRGLLGTHNLNAELQKCLNPHGRELIRAGRNFRINDKVMQIRNNYDKEVFNGDIGNVVNIDLEEQELTVQFEDRGVIYDFSELDELVLAYAVSVHKAQGSEYPAVVIPLLTQHYVMLQRNLLYTAVTRGKKLVVIIGTKKALAIALKNDKIRKRYSHLRERLMC
jgi:exodeoxyribonuclease V alpha subunit